MCACSGSVSLFRQTEQRQRIHRLHPTPCGCPFPTACKELHEKGGTKSGEKSAMRWSQCFIAKMLSLVLVALHCQYAVRDFHVSCDQYKIFAYEAEHMVHCSERRLSAGGK